MIAHLSRGSVPEARNQRFAIINADELPDFDW
jgi:hypothetical protein